MAKKKNQTYGLASRLELWGPISLVTSQEFPKTGKKNNEHLSPSVLLEMQKLNMKDLSFFHKVQKKE